MQLQRSLAGLPGVLDAGVILARRVVGFDRQFLDRVGLGRPTFDLVSERAEAVVVLDLVLELLEPLDRTGRQLGLTSVQV
jgi:hypothetical protein